MAALGASRDPRRRSWPLTEREAEVLGLVAEGLPDKTIARSLGISYHTVRAHISAILRKSASRNRAAAVHWWVKSFDAGDFAG